MYNSLRAKLQIILTVSLIFCSQADAYWQPEFELLGEYAVDWMWIDQVVVIDSFALVNSTCVQILDISDPSKPERAGQFYATYLGSGVGDPGMTRIAISGEYVYLLDDKENALKIFYFEDIRYPEQVGEVEIRYNESIAVQGDFVYCCFQGGKLAIIDVTDKENPEIISELESDVWFWKLSVDQDMLYSISSSGITYCDISEPEDTQIIYCLERRYPDQALSILAEDNLLYIAGVLHTEDFEEVNVFEIIDFTEQDSFEIVTSVELDFRPTSIQKVDDLIYLSSSQAGITIIDVSNTDHLEIVGGLEGDSTLINIFYTFMSISGTTLYLYGNNVDKDLKTFDIENTEEIEEIGYFNTLSRPSAFDLKNDLAYVAGENGIYVIDISLLPIIKRLNMNEDITQVRVMKIEGNRLFALQGSNLLRVFDISDSLVFEEVGTCTTSGRKTQLEIVNSNLAIANGQNGMDFIDISVSESPAVIGNYEGIPRDFVVLDDKAYLACSGNGIKVLNISDPTDIEEIDEYDFYSRCIAVNEMFLYIGGYNGLYVFDATGELDDPIGSLTGSAGQWEFRRFEQDGTFIFGNTNYNTYLIDATDHENIDWTGYTPYTAGNLTFENGLIYQLDSHFRILDPSNAYSAPSVQRPPQSFSLLTSYPNPFNNTTLIRYSLPVNGEVSLNVIDETGRRIEAIFDGYKTFGEHSTMWDAAQYPAGNYFLSLQSGNETLGTTKVTLIK